MEDKKLEVLESRVLAAAEKCGEFKGIAKELWPDTFNKEEDITNQVSFVHHASAFTGNISIQVRFNGNTIGTLRSNGTWDLIRGFRSQRIREAHFWFRFYKTRT